MAFIVFFAFLTCFALPAYSANVSETPPAPTVTVESVQSNYVTLDVSGPVSFNHSPVSLIRVHIQALSKKATEGKSVHTHEEQSNIPRSARTFNQAINVTKLVEGTEYMLTVTMVNANRQVSTSSAVKVLLLPPAPSVNINHVNVDKLIISWTGSEAGTEDYFIINVSKETDKSGCGVGLNISTCFSHSYSFSDLQRQTLYNFQIKAHNPSGFSEVVSLNYPID